MFDFFQYINQADKWIKETEEAYKRSAVSRAYYGAFMCTKKYLAEIGELPKNDNGNSHEAIWYALRNLGPKERIIANIGFNLKSKRQQADYENTIKYNLASWSNQAVYQAKSITNKIADLQK